MMMMTTITFINESLVSDTLTMLCVRKTMYDLRSVTLSKLLNPSEPQFSLFCEIQRVTGISWGFKDSRK